MTVWANFPAAARACILAAFAEIFSVLSVTLIDWRDGKLPALFIAVYSHDATVADT